MSLFNIIVKATYPLRMNIADITGLGIKVISNTKRIKAPVSFFNLEATGSNGQKISFENFRGKKTLLVNLASKCGFTPQYDELQKLHQLSNNLVLLGFPSNDFGNQEPGTDSEITDFCRINFGVTFQLFTKDHVRGTNKQPVYNWLCEAEQNGWNNKQPVWNFYKYLVDEEGNLMSVFSSSVSPMSSKISKALK